MTDQKQPGPTGDYPDGKLNEDDEGGLNIGIATDINNKKIIIDFGTPTRRIGMDPKGAMQLAMLLVEHARPMLDNFDELMKNMSLEPKDENKNER